MVDLTGSTFGRLTVKSRAPNRSRCAVYACTCSCGRAAEVPARYLRNGQSQSCGCLQRERAAIAQDRRWAQQKAMRRAMAGQAQ